MGCQRVTNKFGYASDFVYFCYLLELPGFYYDPEKKRYFRLLPGHNNCNPLTKESIQHKAMESKRLRLLEEEEKQNKVRSERDCNYPLLCSV